MTTASATDPRIARGVLHEIIPTTATRPGVVVIAIPGSQYQLHLRPDGPMPADAPVGKRILGIITAQAKRVDHTVAGGRFVEPVFGRPRRVQGTILHVDAAANALTINAGGGVVVDGLPLPIVCVLTDARQKAADYHVGQFVGFDVLDGASFKRV
ncbi:MAG: hypothetical protein MUE97_04195 [Phycisphaerales bacterium]|jgi:hypothetical protein|nr:hypothetical protein [Phycisphaerales bacterium]